MGPATSVIAWAVPPKSHTTVVIVCALFHEMTASSARFAPTPTVSVASVFDASEFWRWSVTCASRTTAIR